MCEASSEAEVQAMEAVGVADLDKEFLGHKHIKNVKATINNDYETMMAASGDTPTQTEAQRAATLGLEWLPSLKNLAESLSTKNIFCIFISIQYIRFQ